MTETAAAIAFNPGRGTPVAGSVGFRAPFSETRIVRLGPAEPELCAAGREPASSRCADRRSFPGYVDPAHNIGTLAPRRLADDRRCRLPDRRRAARADRPREGPDHPRAATTSIRPRSRTWRTSFPACRSARPSACRTSMPARCRRSSSCRRPARRSISRRCRLTSKRHVHEPPARPRSVLVIDALPVTAVGKIFKPALRDLAIKEKVRLEVERICGPSASASVEVSTGRPEAHAGRGRAVRAPTPARSPNWKRR